ncbi:DUF4259 domain-containing protein [Streptacidiphilus sp. PAMC 29251]
MDAMIHRTRTGREGTVGTWDFGPFDNDQAADLAFTLDEANLEDREDLVRKVLERAANATGYLDAWKAQEAVAAAALIAAQCPGGEPCSIYGPLEKTLDFPAYFRMLAVDALDHVVTGSSELAELWAEAINHQEWRQAIVQLRDVLCPPVPPQTETLFEV